MIGAMGAPPPEDPLLTQSLAQEQALFDRNMKVDGHLVKLQLAMGWMTFFMIPASIAAVLLYPPAIAGTVPLMGISAWNWRRMLSRNRDAVEVVTKRLDSK